MHLIRVVTHIAAPAERCFDLARDIDAHLVSTTETGERVVAGRTSGLMEFGDTVTFEARHLGVRQRLTSRITAFDRPRYFRDRMVRDAFQSFEHDHFFETLPDGRTRMTDVLRFRVPFGVLGWPAGRWIVGPYLGQFLVRRAGVLKTLAERK